MYRLLVVDDENYVVDSIASMFESYQELELDVYRAYSATETLGWLNRAKIDIIIMDILMPDMSGIELAKMVKLSWPQCKIIYLTAHAEFDYAYEAIKNNVVGYILKTESEKRILAEVEKAVQLLDEDIKNHELEEQVRIHFHSATPIIRREIMLQLLREPGSDQCDLFKQLQNSGSTISFDKPVFIIVGRLENQPSDIGILERYRKFSLVQKTLEQYFGRYYFFDSVDYGSREIICIMQLQNRTDQDMEITAIAIHEAVYITGMLESVQKSCLDTFHLHISFVFQGIPLLAGQLPQAFQDLEYHMSLHAAASEDFIITNTAWMPKDPSNDSEKMSLGKKAITHIEDNLRLYLANNNRDAYMEEYEQIGCLLAHCTSWQSNDAWEIFIPWQAC